MKKTLTVNLGGTVFHIDEDAYKLLDKYLSNLRIHFKKEEGSDEIMDDFEMRISELFNERIRLGYDVITIVQVEEVIKRMGKPEELFGEDYEKEEKAKESPYQKVKHTVNRRFFRDPDDRVLGGVASGIAAYLGLDPTLVRLVWFLLMFFFGVAIPIYFILWLIVPVAQTATEKLQMRGESVTIENIGKTVTDGFERVSNNVDDYISSGKPRTALQKFGDILVSILGVFLKVLFVLVAVVAIPPLLFGLFILFIVLIALLVGGIGALTALPGVMMLDPGFIGGYPQSSLVIGSISSILLIGIPVVSAIYATLSYFFKFRPVNTGVKWALVILWIVSLIVSIYMANQMGWVNFVNDLPYRFGIYST